MVQLIYRVAKKCEHPNNLFQRLLNIFFTNIMISYGYLLYLQIRKKNKCKIIIYLPTKDAGDVLYFSYFKDYCFELHGWDEHKYIYLCNSYTERVAKTVGIKNTLVKSQPQISAIAMAHHYKYSSMKCIYNLYSQCIFDYAKASNSLKINRPNFNFNMNDIIYMFDKYKLECGNTVVLAPYQQAVTADGEIDLPIVFWENIANKLKIKGYCVCTNCAGTTKEPAIKGTCVFYPKLADCEKAVSSAGAMISIRSGFVDFVNNADAKMIVLYPSKKFHDMWSIKALTSNLQYWEIIYGDEINTDNEINNLINKIV